MSEFMIVSLVLLGVMLIDAAGDAFRIHQWQNLHHAMEVVGVGAWIAIWALFEFSPIYIVMYITGRIAIFDPVLNLIAGYKLTYAGKSSVYGRLLSWFMSKVKNPGILIWIIRALALIWWVAWFVSRADGQIF
jgi:hypothetical protein